MPHSREHPVTVQEPHIAGFRQMTVADIEGAYRLLSEYLKQFDFVPMFTVEEFTHFFVPRPRVIDSYVVEVRV